MSETIDPTPLEIRHGGTRLALFPWRDAEGPPLLLLHALYANANSMQRLARDWPGPVFGLDLSGHGRSDWREGGAYSGELFAADADAALAEIARESDEPVVLAGEGIGAYASLLLAGGRPEQVRAAVLASGRGLDGGGAVPDPDAGAAGFERDFLAPGRAALENDRGGVDPRVAMAESDPRPPDYACHFAQRAKHIRLMGGAGPRPPWWRALGEVSSVQPLSGSLAGGLKGFVHQ